MVLFRPSMSFATVAPAPLWDSIDPIKRFAGQDYTAARYYPEDDDYLLEREPGVIHTGVLMAATA